MKQYPALASIEFRGIAVGMYATDAMLKKSPISLIRCGTISQRRYLAILGGTTASVDEAFNEGLFWGKDAILDHTFLPDVHQRLHDAILGAQRATGTGSIAVLETDTVSCNLRAAEMALKGTPVELLEVRMGDTQMGGHGLSIFQGDLHDIEAAMDIALGFLDAKNYTYTHRILTSPHEAMVDQINASTRFNRALNLELEDGEHKLT